MNAYDPTGLFSGGLSGQMTVSGAQGKLNATNAASVSDKKRGAIAVYTGAVNVAVNVIALGVAAMDGGIPSGVIYNYGYGGEFNGFAASIFVSLYIDISTRRAYIMGSIEAGIAPGSLIKKHRKASGTVRSAGFVFNAPTPGALSGAAINSSVPRVFTRIGHLVFRKSSPGAVRGLQIYPALSRYLSKEWARIRQRPGVVTTTLGIPSLTAAFVYGSRGYGWAATGSYTFGPYLVADLNDLQYGAQDLVNRLPEQFKEPARDILAQINS